MNKKNLLVVFAMLCTAPLYASSFEELLTHTASTSRPFFANSSTCLRWIEHLPSSPIGPEGEADSRGQIDIAETDLDGDGKDETIKAIWGPGVTDHSLTIELYKGKALFDTVQPLAGIQPNYKVEDIDGDGNYEIIIWGGLWDPRMPGEDGVTEKTREGHSGLHRYVVATYKLLRGQYYLWDAYTTKKKYEPFCNYRPI